jgi:S1-C subfamily serine protease
MREMKTIIRRGLGSRRVLRALAGMLAALILVAGLSLATAACDVGWGGRTTSTVSAGDTAAGVTTSSTDTAGGPDASANVVTGGDGLVSPAAEVARVLGPSVVNIRCTGSGVSSGYFQLPGQGQYGPEWEGSGVIYSSDGKIITNNHVVTGGSDTQAQDIEVTLATGEKLAASVVGTDSLTDLAVIKVNAGFDLPAATFATDLPILGEYVVALGSPDGYQNSVNLGIVSGLDRSVKVQDGMGVTVYTDLIQTDAGISSGNSGGALANVDGQVVGIPSVAVQSVDVENIGFAIPSALVKKVADEIIATGKATHAYIGVGPQTVTSALQQQFGLARSSGILVAELGANGPAAKAGIQMGDIITKVGNEDMREAEDLLAAIRGKKPGDKVDVTIDRKGKTLVLTVTLEERPASY